MTAVRGLQQPHIWILLKLLSRGGQHANKRIVERVNHLRGHCNVLKHRTGAGLAVVIFRTVEPEIPRGDPVVKVADTANGTRADTREIVPETVRLCVAFCRPKQSETTIRTADYPSDAKRQPRQRDRSQAILQLRPAPVSELPFPIPRQSSTP